MTVPLKPTTVRFADDGHALVAQAAEAVGSSFAQFIREAAIMRAMFVLHDQIDPDIVLLVDQLARKRMGANDEALGGNPNE